jgi:hypothetical protein
LWIAASVAFAGALAGVLSPLSLWYFWPSHVNWATTAAVISALAAIATFVVLGLTAFYAYMTAQTALSGLRDAQRSLDDAKTTRHGQVLTELSRRWDEERTKESIAMFNAYGVAGTLRLIRHLYPDKRPRATRWRRKRRLIDLELMDQLTALPMLIETIGVLHDESVLEPDVIYKMWGPQIIQSWDVWRLPIEELRTRTGLQGIYFYFQELRREMVRQQKLVPLVSESAPRPAEAEAEADTHGSGSSFPP